MSYVLCLYVAFCLTHIRTFYLAGFLSDIPSDAFSDADSGILIEMLFGMYSGNLSSFSPTCIHSF